MTRSRTRMTADERMEQLVAAAVTAFAGSGYAGTTTDEVARLAGVTQPYVIRLFGTKRKLFLAAVQHVCDRMEQAFHAAAASQPDLAALGDAYTSLIEERELLLVFLHGLAASADPEVGALMRARFGKICALVRELTGATGEEAQRFLATGMLLTVLTAMQAIGPGQVPVDPAITDLVDTLDLKPVC